MIAVPLAIVVTPGPAVIGHLLEPLLRFGPRAVDLG